MCCMWLQSLGCSFQLSACLPACLASKAPIVKGLGPPSHMCAGSVPRYSRLDPLGLVGDTRLRYGWQAAAAAAARDGDLQAGAQRYFSAASFLRERSKRTKRVHLEQLRAVQVATPVEQKAAWQPLQQQPGWAPGGGLGVGAAAASQPPPAFIPFTPEQEEGRPPGMVPPAASMGVHEEQQSQGLTAEEWVLQRTRQWNIATRERPQMEQLWLGFAAWQDEAARLLQRK